MFIGCSSLKEINLSNFKTDIVIDMSHMFSNCSDELKMKRRSQYKNFKEISFYDYDYNVSDNSVDSDNSEDN